ncbi:leucine-rich repeat domain-containing protein [Blautia glucerasea]|uniref:leucine-rich repeat domain-containing protein n=1 Tax=Blautia TaxID=572511 RepID=UPI00156EBCC4|nr:MULTISPECIES: leucine-rich repeat domain-containing protein [Blautia]MCB5384106.1 leucine-rich repeat domain-containing protein [Blautia glucerasea]NSJ70682.1 leucine-rich repeat domain-containing protein [Blautia faecis]
MKKWFKAHGCSLYGDLSDDKDTIEFTDIIVNEGTEELRLAGIEEAVNKIVSYDFKSCGRTFPNVKKLVIGMLTQSVSIKNSLFPNVREVKSNTSSFKSGDMLVKQTEGSGDVLLNTFCKKKDEKIDLKGIMIISDWAFDGCMSVNVLNEEEIRVCERYAFNNSALLMQPFTDGLRFAGRILIDAEEGADARLPKNFILIGIWIATDLRKLNSIRIEDYENLKMISFMTKGPKRIIFADKKKVGQKELLQNVSNPKLEYFDLESRQRALKSIDGVLYSKKGDRLICCPAGRRHLVIPEGVTEIEPRVFSCCDIESVEFPDSLRIIGEGAFSHCDKLKSIKFGNGIEKIGSQNDDEGCCFAYCTELEEIEFPPSLKYLGQNAFYGCKNLKRVRFNDGLMVIDKDAFNYCTNLKEVTLPYSLQEIGWHNFSCTEKINMKFDVHLLAYLAMALAGSKPQDFYVDIFFSDLNRHVILPIFLILQGRGKLLTAIHKSETVDDVIQNTKTLFREGYTFKSRYRTAIKQYQCLQLNEAKSFLIFDAEEIAADIIESDNEEDMVNLLMLGIIPEEHLKIIQDNIEITKPEWTTSLAYILESLRNCDRQTNQYDI